MRAERVLALFIWTWAAWILLTWTRTWSQLLFGAGFALLVAIGCSFLGDVLKPWRLLNPLRLSRLVVLGATAFGRVVRANLSLARRIWTPQLPLRTGMIIVPTELSSEGGLGAVGIITSVIVDNQIVDADVADRELQYHAVWITSDDPGQNRAAVNGPVEDHLKRLGAT